MPARRAAPLAVGLVAIGIVAILVARPWSNDPGPSPIANLPSPSELPTGTAAAPPAPPRASATPLPLVLPTPDFAPLSAAGEFSLVASPGSAPAQCHYTREQRGERHLASMQVQPPTVLIDSGSSATDIPRIGWRFELEMNRQQTLFHRDWETVARSRSQVAAAVDGRPAHFTPLVKHYDATGIDDTAVFRARVIIEWYTRNAELAGRAELFPDRYQEAGDELVGSWPIFCSGVRRG